MLGVGALLVLGIISRPFEISQAHAASFDANIETARQVIATVPPIENLQNRSKEIDVISPPEGFLSKPLIAETKITRRATANSPSVVRTSATKTAPVKVKLATDGRNHFTYGYCTYYVASRRNIPWFGNAGTWLSGARAAGFATGSAPQAGAIIVTSEGRVGHVGIVESVNGDGTITISEMNYSGFARITWRTISSTYGAIKGYIY